MNGTKSLRDFSQQIFRANTKNALKGEKKKHLKEIEKKITNDKIYRTKRTSPYYYRKR